MYPTPVTYLIALQLTVYFIPQSSIVAKLPIQGNSSMMSFELLGIIRQMVDGAFRTCVVVEDVPEGTDCPTLPPLAAIHRPVELLTSTICTYLHSKPPRHRTCRTRSCISSRTRRNAYRVRDVKKGLRIKNVVFVLVWKWSEGSWCCGVVIGMAELPPQTLWKA